jgi:lysophospholipid acyltransferase (LPLAT)-like uncharacterized protein
MLHRRRVLEIPAFRQVAAWLTAFYIRLVWRLGRWTVENEDVVTRLVAAKRTFIVCFWHGRLLMMPPAWRYGVRVHIVISRHRDGQFIAQAVDRFGISTIAGSSSKGGHAALRSMLQALARGECVAVTPDGPRGPRMRATAGVVRAARIAGVPLVPVTFAVSRRRVLSSWDRFVLPLPFARGVIAIGAPIEVAGDAGPDAMERARGELEAALNDLTREADARFGFAPIGPAFAEASAGRPDAKHSTEAGLPAEASAKAGR